MSAPLPPEPAEPTPAKLTAAAPPAAPFPAAGAIRAVLFDLDQTLLEVQGAWRSGFVEAIEQAARDEPRLRTDPGEIHDHEYRPAVMRLVNRGDGDWDSDFPLLAIGAVFQQRGVEDRALLDRAVETYHHGWLRRTALFPDATRTLDTLAGRLPLGLITDGATREQRAKIERHALDQRFEVILVSREVGQRKPHSQMFEQALHTLGVPAEAAIYVGDNPHRDVVGALGSGLGAVWVNRGGDAYPQDVPRPHHEVPDLSTIPTLVGIT